MRDLVKRSGDHLDDLSAQLEEADHAVLASLLVVLRTRDADTFNHSGRTFRISALLGRECGLDSWQMRTLGLGALLHDIGKIGVPDAVLRKPGKLDDGEWAVMRRHPRYGQDILRGITFLGEATRVVAQHHENWDGSGYPLGLRGEEIDLSARVLIVADAFDAMTSERAYRPARSYGAAAAELDRCAGAQFDPRVVAAFHRVPRGQLGEVERGEYSFSLPHRVRARRRAAG